VTGAARGIGLAITERLLADGARVALVDRDPEVEAVTAVAQRRGQ
jgi:NAD(P)-dependent dehydrogenase (short-subunit alcohol dehydrogenase family)